MSTPTTPRRDFLSQLATLTAVATVGGACAPSASASAAAAPAPTPTPPRPAPTTTFDDSWTTAVVAAKHKAVFDQPDVAEGIGLFHVGSYLRGYKAVFNTPAEEIRPVLVLRHEGTVLAMDDALWAKYALGKDAKFKDPETKKFYTYNPVSRPHTEPEKKYASSFLEAMIKNGVTVLACNQALTGFAGVLASRHKVDQPTMYAELKAGLVPGVILQPSGIYATLRAQEVGCLFMRSS